MVEVLGQISAGDFAQFAQLPFNPSKLGSNGSHCMAPTSESAWTRLWRTQQATVQNLVATVHTHAWTTWIDCKKSAWASYSFALPHLCILFLARLTCPTRTRSPYSSVVERRSCKPEVRGSIPRVGMEFCLHALEA